MPNWRRELRRVRPLRKAVDELLNDPETAQWLKGMTYSQLGQAYLREVSGPGNLVLVGALLTELFAREQR